MAIGGMIGGGIFSVLGVTIDLAGHLAFAAFLLGGAIAMLTARAYARLALRSGRSGGPFAYLREEGHPTAAAWVAWMLIAGYVFALAVYAFTFGHYLAHALGAPGAVAHLLSVAVLALFVAVNLRGVAASGRTEDLVVAVKLLVLGGISLVGIGMFDAQRLSPLDDKGLLGVLPRRLADLRRLRGLRAAALRLRRPRPAAPHPAARPLHIGRRRRVRLRRRDPRLADARLRPRARRAEGGRLRGRRPAKRWAPSASGRRPSPRSSRPARRSTRPSSRPRG